VLPVLLIHAEKLNPVPGAGAVLLYCATDEYIVDNKASWENLRSVGDDIVADLPNISSEELLDLGLSSS
jgi:hypothetical protein